MVTYVPDYPVNRLLDTNDVLLQRVHVRNTNLGKRNMSGVIARPATNGLSRSLSMIRSTPDGLKGFTDKNVDSANITFPVKRPGIILGENLASARG